jgi:hypothetical protein
MLKYANLWKRFGESEFDYTQAALILDEKLASVVINHLKRNGWVEIALNPDDSRKRLYRLKSPEKAVEEMAK